MVGHAKLVNMASITVSTYEAKVQLSRLLAACERGDDVVITRGAKPVARLVPIDPLPPREFGFLNLNLTEADMEELMAPLDDEELALWYDGPVFPE